MVDWGQETQRRPEWLGLQGVKGLKGPGKSCRGWGGVLRRSADFILAAVGKH